MRWRPLSTQAPEAKAPFDRLLHSPNCLRDHVAPFFHDQHRPPLRFLRLACSWLKYSEPRLAIFFPPFRPSLTAARSFFFGKI